MGMHPSATLYYGIYLGCPDEDDMPEWFTDSDDVHDELDVRLSGIPGVGHDTFGFYDYPRYVICTRTVHCWAYNDVTIDPGKWHVSDEEAEALKRAWTALGMQGDYPKPRWFLTTSYG